MPLNNYGVYQDGSNPVLWVKTSSPLVLSSEDQAQLYSEIDAMTVANYLNSFGEETYRVGRPKNVPHH